MRTPQATWACGPKSTASCVTLLLQDRSYDFIELLHQEGLDQYHHGTKIPGPRLVRERGYNYDRDVLQARLPSQGLQDLPPAYPGHCYVHKDQMRFLIHSQQPLLTVDCFHYFVTHASESHS